VPQAALRYNAAVRAAVLLLFSLACAGDPAMDAGADAGAPDAAPDSGVVLFACKNLSCNASEAYCKLTPVGPCTLDAGTCAAGQEECVTSGTGCTPERTPSCEAFGSCAQCPCLIQDQVCGPGQVSIQCRAAGGTITLECPYP
jgi:hypothetical protein